MKKYLKKQEKNKKKKKYASPQLKNIGDIKTNTQGATGSRRDVKARLDGGY